MVSGLVSKASNWLGPFARSTGRSQAKLLSMALMGLRKEQAVQWQTVSVVPNAKWGRGQNI